MVEGVEKFVGCYLSETYQRLSAKTRKKSIPRAQNRVSFFAFRVICVEKRRGILRNRLEKWAFLA